MTVAVPARRLDDARRAADRLDGDEIVALALDALAVPSPAGHERALAARLGDWVAERSDLPVALQEVPSGLPAAPDASANLVVGDPDGPALALYGHVDTSLSGDPDRDHPLVDRPGLPTPAEVVDGVLWGHGAAVAKAPTAAALVAAVALDRALGDGGRSVGVLVAAGGTHRARAPWSADPSVPDRPMGSGVRAALGAGYRPGAVVVAKGGAPGPLAEEPGCLYLGVRVAGRYRPALADPVSAGFEGTASDVIAVVGAVERWKAEHLTERESPAEQLAPDVTLGAVSVGAPGKLDVHADHGWLGVHVITVPGDDGERVRRSLARSLASDPVLGRLGLGTAVDVVAYGELPPGRTDPEHPVVVAAREAWRAERGPRFDPPVRGWRGATDGALLRSLGVATVRLGPPLLSDPEDPRREGVAVEDLLACARMWMRTAVTYLERTGTGA